MPRSPGDPWHSAVTHLASVDTRWARRIAKVGPCALRPMGDRYGTLVRSIVAQQISTKAADSIRGRLLALVGNQLAAERVCTLDVKALRGVGLSERKAGYILHLSEAVASGRLPLARLGRWSDERVIQELTKLPGIGQWTAEMFLVFELNRPDVLSVGDLGIRQGIQRHFELAEMPKPAHCRTLAEPWRPYRSVAMWYLWREVDESW